MAIVDVNENAGEKTAESLRAMGVDACFIACDVTDKKQVQAMTAAVVDRFGHLDIAVNNAGISIPGNDESYAKEDWDKVIGINLTGLWLCAQAQAQQMMKQTPTEGKILNIASMAARISIPGAGGAYDASKAGVVHLTRTLASQWGRFNINVNSISPSHVMTPLFSHATPEVRQRIREITPMGHLQRPEDLYGPVMFLASSASNYVTGHDLLVDGVMFSSGPKGVVYALDAQTGQQRWLFEPHIDPKVMRNVCCGVVNRGVAVWRGKVFVVSIDGYLYTLDADKGAVIWKVDSITDRDRGYTITGTPYIAANVVVIGNSGAEYSDLCGGCPVMGIPPAIPC